MDGVTLAAIIAFLVTLWASHYLFTHYGPLATAG